MNYNTERVKNYTIDGDLESQKRKYSQEFYVLAVLKYLYSEKFKKAEKNEMPDIIVDDVGIEVTVADDRKEYIAKSNFSNYCNSLRLEQNNAGNNDKIKKILSKMVILLNIMILALE